MMNDKKQSKNLLSRLREDKRSVLYVNETTRNTLAKKKKKNLHTQKDHTFISLYLKIRDEK